MFYYEEKKKKYYIWSDKSVGKYGPFEGIYVKNKEMGNTDENIDYNIYPGYKYSLGISREKIFLLNEKGVEDIFNRNK